MRICSICVLVLLFGFSNGFSQKIKIEDDVKHVYCSAIINNVVGYQVYKKTGKVGKSIFIGSLTSLSIGLLKETIWDKRASKIDIFYNIWGNALGAITLRCYIDIKQRR